MFRWREKIAFKGDKVLWYVVIMLMIASVMVVYSSTGRLAYNEKGGNTMFYLLKQLFLIGGCFGVMFTLQTINYRYFSKYAGILLVISLGLLLYAAVGGANINGAGRWIRIPFVGITFQPSELAKIAIMMYAARILTFAQTDHYCDDSALKRFLIYIGPVIFVIFLDNFSTSALISLVCVILFMVGRLRWKLLGITIGCGVAAVALVLVVGYSVPQAKEWGRIGTMVSRVTDFAQGGEDGEGYSFQSVQAKIAVAKGGLFGVGPGNSSQRNFLPHPYSDFIYAIIIEEYGWFGGAFIMLLYLIILFRVGVIVRRCTRIYPALLVTGLGLTIVLQGMVNMGVCVGFFPVTGQTLPLISLGGTSLLFTSASFGIILSVSHTFSPEGEAEEAARNGETLPGNEPEDSRDDEEDNDLEPEEEPLSEDQLTELPAEAEASPRQGRRRKMEQIPEPEENIDMIDEQGMVDIEEELQSEGRKVLKELNRRGRRG